MRDTGGADVLLDPLGRGFADQQVVVTAHEIGDGFVHLVATNADRLGIDDTRQRQHSDFGRAAADIDDHRACRFVDRQTGADSSGHGLVEQADAARRSVQARIVDGAALDRGGARRHADDDLRVDETLAVMDLADEVLDHFLGDFEVGDDPVAHRTDGFHMARRPAQHLLGLDTDGVHHLAAADIAQRHDGRFIEDDAASLHIDQRICRTKVDGNIVGKTAEEGLKHGLNCLGVPKSVEAGITRGAQDRSGALTKPYKGPRLKR